MSLWTTLCEAFLITVGLLILFAAGLTMTFFAVLYLTGNSIGDFGVKRERYRVPYATWLIGAGCITAAYVLPFLLLFSLVFTVLTYVPDGHLHLARGALWCLLILCLSFGAYLVSSFRNS
jgi:hypothetical protein